MTIEISLDAKNYKKISPLSVRIKNQNFIEMHFQVLTKAVEYIYSTAFLYYRTQRRIISFTLTETNVISQRKEALKLLKKLLELMRAGIRKRSKTKNVVLHNKMRVHSVRAYNNIHEKDFPFFGI